MEATRPRKDITHLAGLICILFAAFPAPQKIMLLSAMRLFIMNASERIATCLFDIMAPAGHNSAGKRLRDKYDDLRFF